MGIRRLRSLRRWLVDRFYAGSVAGRSATFLFLLRRLHPRCALPFAKKTSLFCKKCRKESSKSRFLCSSDRRPSPALSLALVRQHLLHIPLSAPLHRRQIVIGIPKRVFMSEQWQVVKKRTFFAVTDPLGQRRRNAHVPSLRRSRRGYSFQHI